MKKGCSLCCSSIVPGVVTRDGETSGNLASFKLPDVVLRTKMALYHAPLCPSSLTSLFIVAILLAGGQAYGQDPAKGKPNAVIGAVRAGRVDVNKLASKADSVQVRQRASALNIAGGEWAQAKRDRMVKHPRLAQRMESRLADAWDQAEKQGARQSAADLESSGAQVKGDKVAVIVQCDANAVPENVATLVRGVDATTVVRVGETHVKALVPVQFLDKLVDLEGVSFVGLPSRKKRSAVTSEGLAAMLANTWNSAGLTGQGVKIAVLDSDFFGLASRIASGELPASVITSDFSGTGMAVGTDGHGCACAEVIYDIAPSAQLYLLKTVDNSDDEAAKNYCKANGITIISNSGAYDCLNFHDGTEQSSITPHPVTIANDAFANGILWVNAAGNEQLQHAMTAWRDGNSDTALDWTSGNVYSPNDQPYERVLGTSG